MINTIYRTTYVITTQRVTLVTNYLDDKQNIVKLNLYKIMYCETCPYRMYYGYLCIEYPPKLVKNIILLKMEGERENFVSFNTEQQIIPKVKALI